MLTSIEGKSVVVTGASTGIGKGIACVFAQKGASVLVVARNEEAAGRTVEEITSQGGTASFCQGDVSSWDDMIRVAQAAAERHGGVDILCSNAGIFPSSKLTDMSVEEWDQVLDTNLKGSFNAVKACVPHMQARRCGRIILTSSITGPVTGIEGWAHYGASKAGQLGFMRGVAVELALDHITINAVMPGNIKIEKMSEEYAQQMAQAIPMRRLGRVEDIAYAALFLASEEAAYITGQTIIVDGGQTLPE